ncbi:MAG: DUF4160 domain-containing protein [Prevotellaceae bacterium]|nr:DUF4160 domain-containing protein [Prevotellaceae bacterium]
MFAFFDFDFGENRGHVHIGKKATEKYCKIWLEPEISVAKQGSLTNSELKEVLELTHKYHSLLFKQWKNFKNGSVKMITIKI